MDDLNLALADMLCEHGLSVCDLNAAGVSVIDRLAELDVLEALLDAHIDDNGAFVTQLRNVVAPADADSDAAEESDIDEEDEIDADVATTGVYRKLVEAIEAFDPSAPVTSDSNTILKDLATATASKTLNSPPQHHEPLIVVAAAAGKLDAVATLLYCGANVNTTSLDGHTLLHVVLAKGREMNVDLAAMLCEQVPKVLLCSKLVFA